LRTAVLLMKRKAWYYPERSDIIKFHRWSVGSCQHSSLSDYFTAG
jgi:hypothetical protein